MCTHREKEGRGARGGGGGLANIKAHMCTMWEPMFRTETSQLRSDCKSAMSLPKCNSDSKYASGQRLPTPPLPPPPASTSIRDVPL